MAQELELYRKCPQCNGTGTFQSAHGVNGSSMPCNWPGCVDGYTSFSKMTLDPGVDDVINKCNDIIDKCNDILEALS
ncbi:MAG: hypothetical protein ACFE9S_07700 [Candidatus Hermodarchaeota archaeon]